MRCIGFTESYVMSVPLQILPSLAADFDGDVLNILLPINETFIQKMEETFSPRNCLYLSRNDGLFNTAVSMQRDTLINANTLAILGKDQYTEEEVSEFNAIMDLAAEMERVR